MYSCYFVLYSFFMLLSGTWAYRCYSCDNTDYPCVTTVECGQGIGCLNHVYTVEKSVLNFYQRGCATHCQWYEDTYCTPQSYATCCTGDLCNGENPLLTWRPRNPEPITVDHVASTSAIVSWAGGDCHGLYTFVINYFTHGIAFGNPSFIYNATSEKLQLSSLEPSTRYSFILWAMHHNRWSTPVSFQLLTNAGEDIPPTPSGNNRCWFVDESANIQSAIRQCSSAADICYSTMNYRKRGQKPYITSGCQSATLCNTNEDANTLHCQPGLEGKSCHFCCTGLNCNTITWTTSFFTCSSVPQNKAVNCATSDDESEISCMVKGCCYDQTRSTKCFYPGRTSGTTTDGPAINQAVSIGLIAGIVIAIIVLIILIILLILWCLRRRRQRRKGSYDVPSRTRAMGVRSVSRDIYDRTAIGESSSA